MKFGATPIADALGAIAVHSVRASNRLVRKGTVISAEDIAALRADGIPEIVTARLEPGDIGEDEAAAALARAVAGGEVEVERAFTGRANLRAKKAGVLLIDRAGVDRLNRVDEAVTFATLPPFQPVVEGEMIGTVKIIPFAVASDVQHAAMAAAKPLISVAPYQPKSVSLISTRLPGLPEKVIEKTVRVTANRLLPAGSSIRSETRISHATAPLTESIRASVAQGSELIIVFGATAIADRRDVIPAAITEAGGVVEHFGMPVDPGNLMLIGRVGDVSVIGAPGCARSPKENGFDWLLARMLAGLNVTRDDITALGVGGLLLEIATRPQPREVSSVPERSHEFAAVVLAAGRGTRMQGENKLLAEIGGKTILRRTVEAALSSQAKRVIVVTGHEAERAKQALKGLDVLFVHNPGYADGLSSSLKAGIAAVPASSTAAAILLADMPNVSPKLIDKLALAIKPDNGALIAVPTRDGKRGNPVVWSRRFFAELAKLEGDTGARHLIGQYQEAVAEVLADDDTIFLDIDTREALKAAREIKTARKA
jgi:molybdenum cofactor cytidylyltransferase